MVDPVIICFVDEGAVAQGLIKQRFDHLPEE